MALILIGSFFTSSKHMISTYRAKNVQQLNSVSLDLLNQDNKNAGIKRCKTAILNTKIDYVCAHRGKSLYTSWTTLVDLEVLVAPMQSRVFEPTKNLIWKKYIQCLPKHGVMSKRTFDDINWSTGFLIAWKKYFFSFLKMGTFFIYFARKWTIIGTFPLCIT